MVQINTSNYPQLVFSTSTPQANFEFFTASGTIVPAWIESYTSPTLTIWVKLVNGIAANSTTTIYLGIGSSSANFLSSAGTSGIGIAPQLGPVYAQYDNGNSVFNNYWNWAGTTIPPNWSAGSGISVSANNKLTIASNTNNVGYLYEGTTISAPFVLEGYGEATTATTGSISLGLAYLNVLSTSGDGNASSLGGPWIWGASPFSWEGFTSSIINFSLGGGPPTPALNTWYILGLADSGTNAYWYVNYNLLGTKTTSSGSDYIGFWADASDTQIYYWLRTRAYPPSGTAPTNTFGSVIYNIYIDTIKFRYGLQLSDYIKFRYGLQINPNIEFRYGLQLSDYIKFRYGLQINPNIEFRYGLQVVSNFNFNNYL